MRRQRGGGRSSTIGVAVVAGALVATTAGAGAGAELGSPPAAQVVHPLHATTGDGARIVDDEGRTVILRGVNVNALGEYYQEWADLPATIELTESDFADIAAHGFNAVRLLITWSSLQPEHGEVSAPYLDRISQALEWARAHDIYVVLDMHQDAWGPWVFTPDGVDCGPLVPAVGWDGAPRWATALVGTAATCRLDVGREFSLAVQTSFENFYLDVGGIQGELVGSWAAVAGRYAADPVVAGYDLLNEPNPGLTVGVSDFVLLGVFYDRALRAIRAAEADAVGGFDHIGFFEPAVLTGPLATPGPLPGFTADANLVYAPHLYNESISPLPFSMEDGFHNALVAARGYGTTFFSGEWGWFGDPVADLEKIARYATLEDEYRIGGTWWQWKQACGDPHAIGVRGSRPPCAEGGDPYSDGLVVAPDEWVTVLTRAYPRAAPGVLTSMDATVATGELTIFGVADRAGATADLWVPARCATPSIRGTNLGAGVTTGVPGGWRAEVPIVEPGPYEITVSCSSSVSPPPTTTAPSEGEGARPASTLPATGGHSPMWPTVLVALAATMARWFAGSSAKGVVLPRARARAHPSHRSTRAKSAVTSWTSPHRSSQGGDSACSAHDREALVWHGALTCGRGA